MPTKTAVVNSTDEPIENLLDDPSTEFEELVQRRLHELNIEQDIIALRHDMKLSQESLAKIAGIKQSYIGKLETGNSKNIELKTLVRIAAALEAEVQISFVKKNQPDNASRPQHGERARSAHAAR
jgi:DNA-binding Xre family transcriptional regulator